MTSKSKSTPTPPDTAQVLEQLSALNPAGSKKFERARKWNPEAWDAKRRALLGEALEAFPHYAPALLERLQANPKDYSPEFLGGPSVFQTLLDDLTVQLDRKEHLERQLEFDIFYLEKAQRSQRQYSGQFGTGEHAKEMSKKVADLREQIANWKPSSAAHVVEARARIEASARWHAHVTGAPLVVPVAPAATYTPRRSTSLPTFPPSLAATQETPVEQPPVKRPRGSRGPA